MVKYYFYCPNCKHEDIVVSIPDGTVGNIRDGYGTPIHHFECPVCSNLDAGYMMFNLRGMSEVSEDDQRRYFQSVIEIYQGIRGFANNVNSFNREEQDDGQTND